MDKHLYSCSSYYQVLITLMKACVEKQHMDIVLEVHGVETAKELAVDIRKNMNEYVDRVFVCPTSEKIDPYIQRDASFIPWQKRVLVKHVEEILSGVDLEKEYSKFCVYWDLGYIGTYLNIKKLKYKLMEDSLNSYQYIKENRPNYRYIFDDSKRFNFKKKFGVGVIPFGYSKYCDEIEVNDIDGIQIPLDKVTASERIELFQKLESADKNAIFKTFFASVDCDFSNKQSGTAKDILILTEPFAVTNRLPSEKAQISLYKDIVSQYRSSGVVYIKPHPRDTLDYKKYFDNIVMLEKNIPMEVLNFSEDFHVATSITVTSSAINGITCADEKIYLDTDFLNKYKE